jgi:cellulose synthase/poly-beta-1,6-N-acetylglucosamine synthase-like glycosyltransferase
MEASAPAPITSPIDRNGHYRAVDQLPLVSVIVPVFQDPEGIRSCLRGLEQQSLPAEQFEVVVVDNGSVPPLAAPETVLRLIRLERCLAPGAYAARNAGVRAARGTYLAFTDADCVPDPRWLESGVRALETAGRDVLIGGEVRFLEPARRTAVSLYQTCAGFQQAENIAGRGFSATANLFCSRHAFDRIGPFAESLLSGGDREWAWRAARAGIETAFAPEAVVATPPRTSLGGALRQARRVAAGRRFLKQSGLAEGRLESLRPHRGAFESFLWILTQRELGWFDRLRVLVVACLIKAVAVLESVRLHLGGRAERR